MTTILDEAAARYRLRVLLPMLTDTETSAALRMINGELSMAVREAALERLAASSENARELLRAFADLCRCFALDNDSAPSAAEIH